jgi:hypothetical protein
MCSHSSHTKSSHHQAASHNNHMGSFERKKRLNVWRNTSKMCLLFYKASPTQKKFIKIGNKKTSVTASVLDVKQDTWPNTHVNVSAHLEESSSYISQKIHTNWRAEFHNPGTSNFFRGTGILFGLDYSLSWLCAELYHAIISKHNVVMRHHGLECIQ